jgi:hypothetical protein
MNNLKDIVMLTRTAIYIGYLCVSPKAVEKFHQA